jgi:hypothetical protein
LRRESRANRRWAADARAPNEPDFHIAKSPIKTLLKDQGVLPSDALLLGWKTSRWKLPEDDVPEILKMRTHPIGDLFWGDLHTVYEFANRVHRLLNGFRMYLVEASNNRPDQTCT